MQRCWMAACCHFGTKCMECITCIDFIIKRTQGRSLSEAQKYPQSHFNEKRFYVAGVCCCCCCCWITYALAVWHRANVHENAFDTKRARRNKWPNEKIGVYLWVGICEMSTLIHNFFRKQLHVMMIIAKHNDLFSFWAWSRVAVTVRWCAFQRFQLIWTRLAGHWTETFCDNWI